MTITPHAEFNKYNFGFGIVFKRTNESEKYIRKQKTISYLFGIIFLWFATGIEIEIRRGRE